MPGPQGWIPGISTPSEVLSTCCSFTSSGSAVWLIFSCDSCSQRNCLHRSQDPFLTRLLKPIPRAIVLILTIHSLLILAFDCLQTALYSQFPPRNFWHLTNKQSLEVVKSCVYLAHLKTLYDHPAANPLLRHSTSNTESLLYYNNTNLFSILLSGGSTTMNLLGGINPRCQLY